MSSSIERKKEALRQVFLGELILPSATVLEYIKSVYSSQESLEKRQDEIFEIQKESNWFMQSPYPRYLSEGWNLPGPNAPKETVDCKSAASRSYQRIDGDPTVRELCYTLLTALREDGFYGSYVPFNGKYRQTGDPLRLVDESESGLIQQVPFRLKLTTQQKIRCQDYLVQGRDLYNLIVLATNDRLFYDRRVDDHDFNIIEWFRGIRNNLTNQSAYLPPELAWIALMTGGLKNSVVWDVRNTITSMRGRWNKKGQSFSMTLHLKDPKRTRGQSISVPSACWCSKADDLDFIFNPNHEVVCKAGDKDIYRALPKEVKHIFRLKYGDDRNYYFIIPMKVSRPRIDNRPSSNTVISIDPGFRTYYTGVDSNGYVVAYGENLSLFNYIDQLLTAEDTAKRRPTWSNIKKYEKLFTQRKQAMTDNIHRMASHLSRRNAFIIIPRLNWNRFVSLLANGNSSALAKYSHCEALDHLIWKAKSYESGGPTVIEVDEIFSSKVCSSCGHYFRSLGDNEVFDCPACPLVCNRDQNGAKNIGIKYYSALLRALLD